MRYPCMRPTLLFFESKDERWEDREEEDSDKDAKYYQQCSATLKRRQNV